MRIAIIDDGWKNFRPITHTRPLADVRTGVFTFAERIQRLFPEFFISVITRPLVAEVYAARTGIPTNHIPRDEGPILVVSPNVIYTYKFREAVENCRVGTAFRVGKRIVAAVVDGDDIPGSISDIDCDEIVEIDCRVIPSIWDLVNLNGEAIGTDFDSFIVSMRNGRVHKNATLYNSSKICVADGAEIATNAVIDARSGPVVIGKETKIGPGSVINGPCSIGDNCSMVSGWIRGDCSFGPECRFGGEIEASIFQGYANKYHEGFVGHSYIGEWVNLGALTTTSDLKNNYGHIRVDLGDGPVDTGRIKVGSFFGDHVKTGIGTLLNSGTYVGVGVNHYGTGLPPKYIPDFSWGTAEGYVEYDLNKALKTVGVVMSRRGVNLLVEDIKLLEYIHQRAKKTRKGH